MHTGNDSFCGIDVTEITSKYQRLRPDYETFTERAYHLILELLQVAEISPQSIEHRTKTVKSFVEKIQREGKSYKNPLEELTDICGVRIIVYTVEDVDRVCRLLAEEFDIDRDNSVDKRSILKPNEFGYLSVHYIAKLSTERSGLREYKNFVDKRLEIQVRTVLQHAWAAIDHRLRYKSNTDAPEHLRRRLFLLSGLLEMADREFSELVINAEHYGDQVREKISENDLIIAIDAQSLNQYISDSETVSRIVRSARRGGIHDPTSDDAFEEEEFYEETISDLAFFCNMTQLQTIKELDEMLASFEPKAEQFYKDLAVLFPKLAASAPLIVIYAVWVKSTRIPTLKDLLSRNWSENFAKTILKVVSKYRS